MSSRPIQRPLLQALAAVLTMAVIVLVACFPGLFLGASRLHDRMEQKEAEAAAQLKREKSLAAQGQDAEAEKELRAALARATQSLGPEHPQTLEYSARLGLVLSKQDKRTQLRELMARDYPVAERVLKPGNPTFNLFVQLRFYLDALGESEERK